MGRHRFEDKDQDQWGGPELAEKRQSTTRHSRDADRDSARTDDSEQPRPDFAKV
ncbi:MAG TPA: hypothetical protein VHC18_06260 [Amycolatopsis sp.]|nr:hypothetical protein [Amycolatopsis sp.]